MSKFSKMNVVLLFFLLLTLVLMSMPYSVSEKFLQKSGDEIITVVKTHAYFSLYPPLHGNFASLISAMACVVATVIMFFSIFSSKKEKNKTNFSILLAIIISIAASATTFFICKTLLSGIITGILFATCVLFFLHRKTDFLKHGNHQLHLNKE